MPAEQLQFIEKCGPDGPNVPKRRKQPYYKFQQDYWSQTMDTIQAILTKATQNGALQSRMESLGASEVAVKAIGHVPDSQVYVMVLEMDSVRYASVRIHHIMEDPILAEYFRNVKPAYEAMTEEK